MNANPDQTPCTDRPPRSTARLAVAALMALSIGAGLDAVGAGAAQAPLSASPQMQEQLLAIQQDWARINYQMTDEVRKDSEFEALAARAEGFATANPGRAEPLIWQGIVLSTQAGVKGGLGALSLAKQAKRKLEGALKLDAAALDGSAYTSLGTLYSKVPGFPLGFGDDRKARQLLESALKVNPAGIDSNYIYAEFLYAQGDFADAIPYLTKALAVTSRPNREQADLGRRAEIQALLTKARTRQG